MIGMGSFNAASGNAMMQDKWRQEADLANGFNAASGNAMMQVKCSVFWTGTNLFQCRKRQCYDARRLIIDKIEEKGVSMPQAAML